MSQETDQTKPAPTDVADGINPQEPPFEPGYQPETLPHISVPDLADDAQGLTAEALAHVPTLTERVDATGDEVEPAQENPAASESDIAPVSEQTPDNVPSVIQDTPVQADTWGQELYARMGKLTDDIHSLNARLDRLEERNKTKA